MLNLKTFIESIQEAVLGANDALVEKNMALLDRFFEADPDVEDLQKKLDAAIDAADGLDENNDRPSRMQVNKAAKAFTELRKVLEFENSAADVLSESDLRPKNVSMSYPIKGKDGNITNKEVMVPLITLVPLTLSQVEQFTLKANLQLHVVDDEVTVHLGGRTGGPTPNSPADGDWHERNPPAQNNVGTVEIVIKPQQMADGMQQVIDAYEKVLKTQLPH